MMLSVQEWCGNLSVEKVDERAHEKGCQDRSDTYKGRNGGNFSAAKKEQTDAQNDTDDICHDADIFEFADLPFVSHDEGDGIIGGYPKVGSDVNGTAEAEGNEPENETRHTN